MTACYEIVIRGTMAPRLAGAVDGFAPVASDEATTRLVGWADQSSLQAALHRLADLGFELVALAEVAPGPDPLPGSADRP